MNLRLAIILAALLGASKACPAAPTNDFFACGLELSHAGQFPEAAAAFEESGKQRPAVGTLVNLGLAEWQRGHAGAAVLAWEQALWIDPFDARAADNLNFARQVAEVAAPPLKWYEAISVWLPANAWLWLAAGSFWLAVALLLLPRVFRRRRTGWQQWLAALSFSVFLFSLTANVGVVSRTQIGFVLKKNAPLLLTPTRDAEVIIPLAAGEPARAQRIRGDYVFVRTQGAAGWLDRRDFGLISSR